MDSHGIHVMTIANSIIGVSIIAMPYCFKQCGIILSIVMLIFSSIISRLSCHFLLKSAIRARLRTFEFLAYHAFGSLGKFIVEVGMIGFLLGTCIAFFVVMGDLGPEIVAQMIGVQNSNTLRSGVLISLALFCVLPLGLLKNVDSLSGVCVATIGFYICLVLKIMAESASHIVTGDWFDKVEYWRTDGALQCIPIFSMALFCQTQLFEIYQAIPNASLDKMNALIRVAVNICTCVYIFVGIFGYVALTDKAFTGNILLSLTPSLLTEVIKIGFVLSLAFSFPLIIFPCRASLFSLIYKPTYTMLHDGGTHFIPEAKFKSLTIFIILISLTIGILTPNIELVLGLVGSTIGVSICVLFPATCFICMVKKNTNERILAQMMLCIGIVVMVLGTYANLNAADDIALAKATAQPPFKQEFPDPQNMEKIEDRIQFPTTIKLAIPTVKVEKNVVQDDALKQIRHEPPHPIEPVEQPEESKPKEAEQIPVVQAQVEAQQPKEPELKEIRHEPPQPVEPEQNINEIKKNESPAAPDRVETKAEVLNASPKEIVLAKQPSDGNSAGDQVDAEAIKKEEKEINQQAQEELKNVVQKLDLISELTKQNQEQQQHIVEQQKKILEEMQQKKKDPGQERIEIDKVKQEKMKAVKEIENIAKKAIESLGIDDPKVESNVVPNLDSKSKPVDLNAHQNLPVIETLKANPAPLSYQLGLNVANESKSVVMNDKSSPPSVFVPFPIVKSEILASTNVNTSASQSLNSDKIEYKLKIVVESSNQINEKSNASEKDSNLSKTGKKIEDNLQEVKSDKNNLNSNREVIKDKSEVPKDDNLEEIKSLRRDILSEDESGVRGKRDLNDSSDVEKVEKSNDLSLPDEDKGSIFLKSLKSSKTSNVTGNKEEKCDKS